MTANIGNIDRLVRIVVGLALVAWAIGLYPEVQSSPWGWIGLIPLLTAFFGFCPLYAVIGISTCGKQA